MTPEELDQLQSELDPAARFVVALLREENAKLREQLAVSIRQLEANVEQIARLTEQLEDFKRRLFGRRSERIPTVAEELRREVAPDELTVDGISANVADNDEPAIRITPSTGSTIVSEAGGYDSYTVVLTRTTGRAKVSVGSNPSDVMGNQKSTPSVGNSNPPGIAPTMV